MIKTARKALCLIFVFLFSINCLAAVVSDNDGSAFITKAEFDSMKNTFQQEIDKYNSTIDNKIESAISGYLSGVKNKKETYLDSMLNKVNALAEDFYLDSSGNEVKYNYRTMARTYNVPTTQKPNGASTAIFISRGDIADAGKNGFARFALDNARRVGMGLVNIANGTYQTGKYLYLKQTNTDKYYPANEVDEYTYYFYVSGAARTVTAGNNPGMDDTLNPSGLFTIEDEFKNERTDWSLAYANAKWVWANQEGNEAYSTIRCIYGTTFQKTAANSLVPICGTIDRDVIALSEKNATKMTLQENPLTRNLYYTMQGANWTDNTKKRINGFFVTHDDGRDNTSFVYNFNCHPYQTLNLKDLVDYYSTKTLDEDVLLTDGIPICKATSDGHIDIKIEFMSRNTTHDFAACLRNEPFENTYYGYRKSPSLHWRNTNDEEYPSTNLGVNLDTEYTWRVDAKKDDVIWLKAVDTSDQYGLVGAKTIEIKQVSNG